MPSVEEMKQYLIQKGLTPPPTKLGVIRMYEYVTWGSFTGVGENEAGRITIVKAAEERWLGKRVRYASGRIGVVVGIHLIKPAEARNIRLYFARDKSIDYTLSPVSLYIKYKDGSVRVGSESATNLLEE